MRDKLVIVGILCAVLLSLGTQASAQPMAGQSSISLSAAFNMTDIEDLDMDTFNLSVDYGQFSSDTLELGAALQYTHLEIEDLDSTAWMILGKAKFHGRSAAGQKTVPYGGIQLGWVRFEVEDASDSSFAWGAMVGAKTYVSPDRFWFYELNYLTYEIEDVDVKSTTVFVGQAFVF